MRTAFTPCPRCQKPMRERTLRSQDGPVLNILANCDDCGISESLPRASASEVRKGTLNSPDLPAVLDGSGSFRRLA